MANGTRRGRLQLSKIYAFSCIKPSVKEDDQSQIEGPGFSRVVYCNDPESPRVYDYASNYVKTTKYAPATFIPKALFEQFRRVANFFLLTGILAFTPIAHFSSSSPIVPLVFVIGVSMIKEGIEDWRCKQQAFLRRDPAKRILVTIQDSFFVATFLDKST
ncbi:hypothetical protein Droror1_Dr00003430 [Drosera rotundifolia]